MVSVPNNVNSSLIHSGLINKSVLIVEERKSEFLVLSGTWIIVIVIEGCSYTILSISIFLQSLCHYKHAPNMAEYFNVIDLLRSELVFLLLAEKGLNTHYRSRSL